MPRQTAHRTAAALKMVLDTGMKPYQAAKEAGIALSTMYRSRLYKMFKAGDVAGLRREISDIRARKSE